MKIFNGKKLKPPNVKPLVAKSNIKQKVTSPELTLATALLPNTDLNIFITNRLFKPSIQKAKRLALQDIRECIASTGIMQTRAFVPIEAYAEYIDSVFRLIWFALYRDYLDCEGLCQSFSYGKLFGITSKVSVPTRIFELAIHVLSPIIIKTEVFIPSPELLPCVRYVNLTNEAPLFSVTLGISDPLSERYGLNFRTGMINIVKNLPGSMTKINIYHSDEVYLVLRNILFRPRINEDPITAINNAIEIPLMNKDDEIRLDAVNMEPRAYVGRCDVVKTALYPNTKADFGNVNEVRWFIPYVYNRIQEEHCIINALSTYLPVVIFTADNIDLNGIRATTLDTDLSAAGTFSPSLVNSVRADFGAQCIQSLKSLRIKEGRIFPRYESNDEIFGIIRQKIISGWKDLHFPDLDCQFTWTQPDWKLPSNSPFFPYQIKWTRQVRIENDKNKQPDLKNRTVRENIHETTDSKTKIKTPAEGF